MEQEAENKTEKVSMEAKVEFLEIATYKVRTMTDNIDSQINILVGISSVILLYSVSRIGLPGTFFFVTMAFFATLTTISGLIAIHPFKFMRKRGNNECITYNKKVTSFADPREYAAEVEKVVSDPKKIVYEVSADIYNMYKYYYQPKRKMYALTRNFLVSGIFISFVALIIELIVK